MIEKQPEGRELMNALFLQVHSKGVNLQQGDVYRVLKFARNRSDRTEAQIQQRLKHNKAACEADLKDFAAKVHQNQKWEFTISRHVENNNRAASRLRNFIERTTQEKNDYEALENIIKASWTKWKDFQTTALANLKKVNQALRRARHNLRSLDEQGALVQLSENSQFFTNLNEIRVDFEGNFVNLEGFRPVIIKLFELMSNAAAVNKPLVRRKLISVLTKISRQVRERRNEIKAINERQNAIFGAIIESYRENLLRINKLLTRLNHENSHLSKRGVTLKDSNGQARAITNLSKNIFTTRKRQCISYAERVSKISVAIQRTRNIVAQIAEILSERFGALKSYFVQRDMSLLQLKRN
jgi:Fe-S cluster biosynthesis and repair protein YggX